VITWGTATTVHISVKIGSVGTSPQVGENLWNTTLLWLSWLLSCPVLSSPFFSPARFR